MSDSVHRPAAPDRPTLLGALIGCNRGGESGGAPPQFPPVAVLAAKAVQKTVPNQLQAIGAVQAFATVNIKARVEGELVGIHFKEGDYVTQGQLLFTIDPRTFQAALNQAKANLARDQATAHQASVDEQRYPTLMAARASARDSNMIRVMRRPPVRPPWSPPIERRLRAPGSIWNSAGLPRRWRDAPAASRRMSAT